MVFYVLNINSNVPRELKMTIFEPVSVSQVQPPDGNFIINYIVDDAIDKGQIRGYHFDPRSIML